jgi:hypothetical protein
MGGDQLTAYVLNVRFSSAGHSSGPPTELSPEVDGRGDQRVVQRVDLVNKLCRCVDLRDRLFYLLPRHDRCRRSLAGLRETTVKAALDAAI